ncbi:hypothetical protein V2W45_1207211, partial [Cenococcum geophilum]
DALNSTKAAITEEKKVRIATAIGSDITYQFVIRQIGDYILEGGRDLVEVIIRVAYRERDYLGVKPAVFVTEDRAIRLKAAIIGVAAVTTSIIKKVL